MGSKITLVKGADAFTKLDLIRKAAAYKGLKLEGDASWTYSKSFKTYALDDKLLAFLAERGIKRQARPDCRDKVFTLVDENPQEKVQGWVSSNYWNFKLFEDNGQKFDLRVSLEVIFDFSIEKRGVIFWPQVSGSFVSPVDKLPNFRMFKALVESNNKVPAIAKELAASDGSIVVTWADLGLGGIRRITDLFTEFAHQNETIMQLSRSQEVFHPAPNPQHQQFDEEIFIIEPVQPQVFKVWRKQLEEYRARLVV